MNDNHAGLRDFRTKESNSAAPTHSKGIINAEDGSYEKKDWMNIGMFQKFQWKKNQATMIIVQPDSMCYGQV